MKNCIKLRSDEHVVRILIEGNAGTGKSIILNNILTYLRIKGYKVYPCLGEHSLSAIGTAKNACNCIAEIPISPRHNAERKSKQTKKEIK